MQRTKIKSEIQQMKIKENKPINKSELKFRKPFVN